MTVNASADMNLTVLPAAVELCFDAEAPYLGVPDNLDRDRLRKRRSWGFFGHSVLCCSILCHSRSAVQSRASLPAPSAWHCQPIHWLFIRMFSSSLLTQDLRKNPTPPLLRAVRGSYLRVFILETSCIMYSSEQCRTWWLCDIICSWSHSIKLASLCHCNFK